MVISNIFYVHPYLGKIPILTNIFPDGLKPPTRTVYEHIRSILQQSILVKVMFAALKKLVSPPKFGQIWQVQKSTKNTIVEAFDGFTIGLGCGTITPVKPIYKAIYISYKSIYH